MVRNLFFKIVNDNSNRVLNPVRVENTDKTPLMASLQPTRKLSLRGFIRSNLFSITRDCHAEAARNDRGKKMVCFLITNHNILK